jgi:KDO2-lipid IV(A) lauroyltransferase
VFLEIGRNVYDFLRFADLSGPERERLVELRGEEVLETVRHRGRGAVLVTGHLGCWELLAAMLASRGYPLLALARPLREQRLEAALRAHRERMGIRTLSSEALPLAALRHLRRGGFLGVLADQRVKQGGHTVTFLGQETRMAEGPVRLAQAAGAPLVPLGIHRGPDQRHRIHVLPPIDPEGDARERTQDVADALGRLIRETPEQWVWIHPRWEATPSAVAEDEPRAARRVLPGKGGPACAAR